MHLLHQNTIQTFTQKRLADSLEVGFINISCSSGSGLCFASRALASTANKEALTVTANKRGFGFDYDC